MSGKSGRENKETAYKEGSITSNWAREYIDENCYSLDYIEKHLGIAKDKLRPGSTAVLNADEFLKLCVLFEVDPSIVDIKVK